MSTVPEYNGWANKPTWQVHPWLSNWEAIARAFAPDEWRDDRPSGD